MVETRFDRGVYEDDDSEESENGGGGGSSSDTDSSSSVIDRDIIAPNNPGNNEDPVSDEEQIAPNVPEEGDNVDTDGDGSNDAIVIDTDDGPLSDIDTGGGGSSNDSSRDRDLTKEQIAPNIDQPQKPSEVDTQEEVRELQTDRPQFSSAGRANQDFLDFKSQTIEARSAAEKRVEDISQAPEDAKFKLETGETISKQEALQQAEQQKQRVSQVEKDLNRQFKQRAKQRRRDPEQQMTQFETLFDPTKGNPDQTLDEELLTGGVDLMQEGEEFASQTTAASERDAGFFRPEANKIIPERFEDDIEQFDQQFSKGIATGGTQLAGFGIAATGATARSLRSDTPGLLEGVASGPGLVKDQVEQDPIGFVAGEAGEEVGEKIVFGGLTGGAGLAASTVPIPEFTPETSPENNLQIEVGQGVDSNRLDSVFAEVDSEGNIQNPQRIENTGQVKGLIGDQETRFQSDQPFLTAEARNQETGELEGTFVGRVSSTGRSSDGQAEGLAESQALRIDEEGQLGNLGDSERKLFDFNVETEDSRSEQLFEIQGRDTIIGEQTTADISGEVGGERFIGVVESTVERNPRLGRRFRSNTLTAQENRRAGIETEGALIREDALEDSDLIITDEGLGSSDSSSTELFDEPEDVQGLEDVLGIDSNQDTRPSEEPSFDSSTGNNQDLELLQETEQGQADNSIEGLAEAEQQAFTETVNDLVETQEPSVDTRNTNTVIGLEDSLQGQRQGPSLEEENVLGLEEFQRQESPPRQEIEENIIPEFEQETSPEPAFEGFEASISQETGIEFAPETRSEPSLEFPGGDSKQEEEDITALFSGSGKDFRFDSSLGAELTGVTAEERPDAFATQDPFNLRPVLENNSNRRSENVENMF